MEIATIGFTRSSARHFFERIEQSGLPALIDVRLNNTSQLAGFAKRDDLQFFLERLGNIAYHEEPLLCPAEEDLKAYRAKKIDWKEYVRRYRKKIRADHVEEQLDRARFARGVILLCSEPEPDHCHRKVAAEYLAEKWGSVEITHL